MFLKVNRKFPAIFYHFFFSQRYEWYFSTSIRGPYTSMRDKPLFQTAPVKSSHCSRSGLPQLKIEIDETKVFFWLSQIIDHMIVENFVLLLSPVFYDIWVDILQHNKCSLNDIFRQKNVIYHMLLFNTRDFDFRVGRWVGCLGNLALLLGGTLMYKSHHLGLSFYDMVYNRRV